MLATCMVVASVQAVSNDSSDSNEKGKPEENRGVSFAHVIYAMTLVRNADAVHAYRAWLEARGHTGKQNGAGGREAGWVGGVGWGGVGGEGARG